MERVGIASAATSVGAIDAVDDAAQVPSVDRDVKWLLEVGRNGIESAPNAIRLQLRCPVAFEGGRPAWIWK